MSLQPMKEYVVPKETVRIAKAAFPKSTLCLRIYDELGTVFNDEYFSDLFPSVGQPAEAPFRLAWVTILQFVEGLSDRAAANAVRSRIDWKYLLCLEMDDSGFDHSVLSEFRARLMDGNAERRLFEKLLNLLSEKKFLKAGGRQRTDSTHVLAAIRNLSRLEVVGETLRAGLNAIASVAPEWIRLNTPSDWIERYGCRVEEYRLPKTESGRTDYANQIGIDGHHLLAAIDSDPHFRWLSKISAINNLRMVWIYNFYLFDQSVNFRDKDNIPPATTNIVSPYDAEARYGRKRTTTWVGYKVHITESCDENTPHLVTNILTEKALSGDNDAIPEIQKALALDQLLPKMHIVDAGYIEAKNLVESKSNYDVDLLGPPQSNGRWQFKQKNGFDLAHFQIDWEHKIATCPRGKTSNTWREGTDNRGNQVINVVFAKSDCSQCPGLSECTTNKTQRRTINMRPQKLHDALVAAREREQTEDFQKEYNLRAGIEGTISQGVRAFELRETRYVGIAKVNLQLLATAAAMNLVRISDWLAGKTPETTRQSAFVRVKLQAA
jgi:transposase